MYKDLVLSSRYITYDEKTGLLANGKYEYNGKSYFASDVGKLKSYRREDNYKNGYPDGDQKEYIVDDKTGKEYLYCIDNYTYDNYNTHINSSIYYNSNGEIYHEIYHSSIYDNDAYVGTIDRLENRYYDNVRTYHKENVINGLECTSHTEEYNKEYNSYEITDEVSKYDSNRLLVNEIYATSNVINKIIANDKTIFEYKQYNVGNYYDEDRRYYIPFKYVDSAKGYYDNGNIMFDIHKIGLDKNICEVNVYDLGGTIINKHLISNDEAKNIIILDTNSIKNLFIKKANNENTSKNYELDNKIIQILTTSKISEKD